MYRPLAMKVMNTLGPVVRLKSISCALKPTLHYFDLLLIRCTTCWPVQRIHNKSNQWSLGLIGVPDLVTSAIDRRNVGLREKVVCDSWPNTWQGANCQYFCQLCPGVPKKIDKTEGGEYYYRRCPKKTNDNNSLLLMNRCKKYTSLNCVYSIHHVQGRIKGGARGAAAPGPAISRGPHFWEMQKII